MKTKGILTLAVSSFCVVAWSQTPAPRQGPGVQGPQDARYASVIAACRNPPAAAPARGQAAPAAQAPRGGGAAQPAAPAQARGNAPAAPREYTVTAIPGVIAAGQQWKVVWETMGNNADGIVGAEDGSLLVAQNDNSAVVKLDKDGKTSVVYSDTNTGGALSMNAKGALFVASRSLNPAILQLAPQRKVLANSYQSDPLDCIGGVLNDVTADSKGGVYFTMGGLFYANPAGVVTRYGENLRTNGVILSPDEKTVYVTNGGTLAAFDVQADGSLTNQREFVTLQGGGGDGSTVDSTGRIYVTGAPGVHVVAPDGKYLGLIPTPRGVITAAFAGPDKKTLYAVVSLRDAENRQSAQVLSITTIAEGFKGRAK